MLYKAIPDIGSIDKWLALELPFEYNDFFNPSLLDDHAAIEKRVKLYNSLRRDRSLDTLHAPFLDIAVHSADPKIRKISDSRIRQACDIATALEVKGVILHTNLIANFYDTSYRENWVSSNEQYFKTLINDYKNLSFYMENMFDEEPDSLCELARRMNHERFGICLDIGHCNISKTDIGLWLSECSKYTKQYHINDNDGRLDSHLAVGEGSTDWNRVLPLLNEETPTLIEVPDYASFIKSRAFLAESI